MEVVLIGALLIIVIISTLNNVKTKNKYTKVTNTGTVNQDSYQRYAKFYEHAIPADILFEDKMNKIYKAITIEKKRDIKKSLQKQAVLMTNVS